MAIRDYVSVANEYIEEVLSGKRPACQFVKMACERQKRDLADGVLGYRFDKRYAARVCLFIENLRHVKGALANHLIHLEPWQVFILTTVFGWVDADGKRRYRHVYIEVPRGNGKSALSSGVALYALSADGEPGAECFTFATKQDQAKIVFDVAKKMVQLSPNVARSMGISTQAHSVTVLKTGSVLKPMSSEGGTLDGLNTHLAVVDELHAHKTRELYDVVETSLGKRRQPLLWVITTAGFDTSGICYEVRDYVISVLRRQTKDDSQFGIIYSIDVSDKEGEGDDWKSEAALIKANPNWGISVQPAELLKQQKKAIATPSAANNFKTKYLDVWCSARSAWMDLSLWDAAAQPCELDELEGHPCVIGLDLGAKNDVTAAVLLFPTEDGDGKTRYYAVPKFYLPEETIERSKNAQYRGWVEEGWITVTDGAMTDLARVEDDLRDWLSRFNVTAIAYDPWQAVQLAGNLSGDGAPMVEYRNTVQNLSGPMKTVEAMVLDGRLTHDGNPMMAWMMGNVVAKTDAKDNIFPRKERYEQKIDGPVALIYATAMTVSDLPKSDGPTEEEIAFFAKNMIVV